MKSMEQPIVSHTSAKISYNTLASDIFKPVLIGISILFDKTTGTGLLCEGFLRNQTTRP